MSDPVKVNGHLVSWSDIYFKVNGVPYYGIKSIGYGDSRAHTKGYGLGRHQAPRGRSAGKYETEPVSVTAEKATVAAVRKALAALSADGQTYGGIEFQVIVQYDDGRGNQFDHELEDCVFSKDAAKHEEGSDPLYEDIEFDCMRIRRDGLTLFDGSEGSP